MMDGSDIFDLGWLEERGRDDGLVNTWFHL